VNSNVRPVIASVAALFLVGVPAALASSGSAVAPGAEESQPTTIERPLLHREAARKTKAAERVAERKATRKRRAALPDVSVPPRLDAIAECESHGNPRSIGGGGLYRGKYQMTTSIWDSVGGNGDPAAASEEEQDRRAALLYQRSGPGQWPVCSQ
jgi:transglycosylase-like protein